MSGMDRLLFKVYFNGLGRRGEADTMAKLTLVHRDKSARAMQYIHYTMHYYIYIHYTYTIQCTTYSKSKKSTINVGPRSVYNSVHKHFNLDK